MEPGGALGPPEGATYSWPGVLNFLQHEYRRHELERTEQLFEIATLKARVQTLERERTLQEQHKLDLLKRVKMLEYALIQERKKSNPAAGSQAGPEAPAAEEVKPMVVAPTTAPPTAREIAAAKRKAALKAYLERFERIESLYTVPTLPPITLPAPLPQLSSAAASVLQVETAVKGVVNEAVFPPASPTPPLARRERPESSDAPSRPPPSPTNGAKSQSAPGSPSAGEKEGGEYRKWRLRGSLRGHLDSVTDVAWHPQLPILVSSSADNTVKCWNLALIYKKDKVMRTEDFDAMHTYRGHEDQVLCVNFSFDNNYIISGSLDKSLKVWGLPPIPPPEEAPYIPRGAGISYLKAHLESHTDAIWDVATHPSAHLMFSASADGTVKTWKYLEKNPLASTLLHPRHSKTTRHSPTSVEVVRTDNRKLLASYSSGSVVVFDYMAEKVISQFSGVTDVPNPTHNPDRQINQVLSHPDHKSLVLTAHEDKFVKYFDLNTGRCVHSMVAHRDAVTSISIDPLSPMHFASVSHDSSLRFWNIATRNCTQDVSSVSLKKWDEALLSVSHSPFRQPLMAVACADSTVKIFN